LGVEEVSFVDVERTFNEAVTMFPELNVKFVNDCCGLVLLADSFLRQLFYNLIDNTRKYGKKTSTVRVHYENEEEDKLKLVYEDDGVGISIEDKLKLFTEGFSTGGSTGFGLFLIKKMMDVYGWQIQESGEPGKGAKFTITIPKLNQNRKENYLIAQ
jgi:signal transduction histidine kinase